MGIKRLGAAASRARRRRWSIWRTRPDSMSPAVVPVSSPEEFMRGAYLGADALNNSDRVRSRSRTGSRQVTRRGSSINNVRSVRRPVRRATYGGRSDGPILALPPPEMFPAGVFRLRALPTRLQVPVRRRFRLRGNEFPCRQREARRPERPAPAPAGVAGLRAGYLLLIRLRRFFSTSGRAAPPSVLR